MACAHSCTSAVVQVQMRDALGVHTHRYTASWMAWMYWAGMHKPLPARFP